MNVEKIDNPPAKSDKQILAVMIALIAFALGIISAFLFNGFAWGINIVLFSGLLAISLIVLRKKQGRPLSKTEWVLIASALFFALSLAWRDSLVLNYLSLFSILMISILAFTLGTRQKLRTLHISQAFKDFIAATQYAILSYPNFLSTDVQWNALQTRWQHAASAIMRGVLITAPIIVIFGLLLVSSDARFESVVSQLFDWDAKTLVLRGFTFITCSWIIVALLRGSILGFGLHSRLIYLPKWRLGSIEIAMMLGMLNLLFLSFIAVQFTYFFGGDTLVQSADGPTYSAYARRGFFQLVAVALLVIVLLLTTDYLHNTLNNKQKKLYQILAIVMVIVTMIIEASAIHRMFLYTRVYGLTELRFYTSIFMLWLVVVFILFTMTVLRERRNYFIFQALTTGLIIITMLLIANPDARIADVNLSRAGQRFDARYVTLLSADVVPTLVNDLPKLQKKQRCELWQHLNNHAVLKKSGDWRNWHVSHYQAKEILSEINVECGN